MPPGALAINGMAGRTNVVSSKQTPRTTEIRDLGLNMQVNFSSELMSNLNSAFVKMQKENLDSYLEPISKFTILRKSSKMAQDLLNQDPMVEEITDVMIPIHMEGEDWILTL